MFYEFYHPIADDYYLLKNDEDFSFSAHLHYCFEMIAVTDGEMSVRVDERDYTLTTGDAVLVFPNQIHSMTTPQCSLYILPQPHKRFFDKAHRQSSARQPLHAVRVLRK